MCLDDARLAAYHAAERREKWIEGFAMSAIHEPDLQLDTVDEALAKGWTIPASWYAERIGVRPRARADLAVPGRSSAPSSSSEPG